MSVLGPDQQSDFEREGHTQLTIVQFRAEWRRIMERQEQGAGRVMGGRDFRESFLKQLASELNPWETGRGMKSKSEEEIRKMMIRWWDWARSRRDCRSDDDLSCVLTGLCSWFCQVLRRGLHHLHTTVCPCPRAVSPGRLGLGLFTFLSFPSNT